MLQGIRIDLDNMREYSGELSELIEGTKDAFSKKVDERAESMSVESRDGWYDWNADRHWRLRDVFPSLLHNSLFIAIYSYLESTLGNLARKMERSNPQDVAMEDIEESVIDRYRKYLKEVQGIDFPDQSREWQRIRTYQKIRNFIVHNGGRVDDCHKHAKCIRNFIEQNSDLVLIDQDQVYVSRQGNLDFLDTLDSFFESLFENID
jgi:hypothetical protein